MIGLKVRKDLEQFFIEDIGTSDLSSELLFPNNEKAEAVVIAKESGVFCGKEVIEIGFQMLDENSQIEVYVTDGDVVQKGDVIACVKGDIRAVLTGERVILNLIQRMSGVATMTARAIELLDDSSIRICDTRKTTPGLRMYEKYAVRCGGGVNHRMTLDGGVMLKDNHIAQFGSIIRAVSHVRSRLGHMTKIEVETSNEEEVREAVKAQADVIMFDNCSPKQVGVYAKLVPEPLISEASGGITLDNLASFRKTGVNMISLGCLTHSVQSLDISLRMKGDL
ncbi:carboxylating nicotinate-nucleotide diphosphorylase [Bacillus sp. RAR_GA_16]|uniref:carboxylating nicotinate-nucleotide diphosphorylase n=1 Tax=Bacillus sp. RAR_GA_16 TaxID=2876774 RepID=UPI001CCD2603|nr:carboxylating nicotinate-nucleotide diphosphorylase [Bacillus sp. RAR_GA_16]MCA0171714.1 carboxylating nicotinate-nucleotide diphosphorylase [Bacillus sp. RAR_GA_16]